MGMHQSASAGTQALMNAAKPFQARGSAAILA